jgi:HSP20 family protein
MSKSKLPMQQRPHSRFPEFGDLFSGLPTWLNIRPVFDTHLIRIEDELQEGKYQVHAEIPGIDPAKDVDITVRDGRLTIKAERAGSKESNGRSEFSYGSFERSVMLPAGADEDTISATYDKGILTVSVPVAEAKPTEKHIPVSSAN